MSFKLSPGMQEDMKVRLGMSNLRGVLVQQCSAGLWMAVPD